MELITNIILEVSNHETDATMSARDEEENDISQDKMLPNPRSCRYRHTSLGWKLSVLLLLDHPRHNYGELIMTTDENGPEMAKYIINKILRGSLFWW